MAKTKADDPFGDEVWGDETGTGGSTVSDEVPEATVDPSRTDWLKPRHLREMEGRFELVSVSDGTEYSDIVLHIKVYGKMFRLGLKNFDPSFVACRKKYGPKKADWKGTLMYRIKEHKGNPRGYVAVRPV